MSSSSSESEGEKERLKEAAVWGPRPGGLQSGDSASGPGNCRAEVPSAKRKCRVPSARPSSSLSQHGGREPLVSTAMQSFLATKLSQFLDSQYEITVPDDTNAPAKPRQPESINPAVGCIRLLSTSQHPVSLEPHPQQHKPRPSQSATKHDIDSDSEEEEEERKRLESAAIDAQTIIDQSLIQLTSDTCSKSPQT